jgi:hypothetical protein
MIRTPSHATVVAYLALVVALSTGSAYAVGHVGALDIKKNAVRSKHIKDGQVRTQDLGASSVTSDKVADGTLTGLDLGANSVTGDKVANGTLTGQDLTDNSVTGADVLESSLGQVPNAATLNGRSATTFLTNSVYKRESALDQGTLLGDNSRVKSVSCDAGDVLLSGGVANVNANSDLLESFPSPGSLTGWTGRLFDNGSADNFSVLVLCLDQTP